MKKFYLFLVALVVSVFAANAAPDMLYVIGDPANGSWGADVKTEPMTKVKDGVFTYTVPGGKYFRFCDGTAQYGPASDKEDAALSDGCKVEVTKGKEAKAYISRNGDLKITVVFNGENATLHGGNYNIGGGDDTDPTTPDLYFYQSTGSWNSTGTKMNYAEGVYTLDVDFTTLTHFTFRTYADDLKWGNDKDTQWGPSGDDTVELNKVHNVVKKGNAAFECKSLTGIHTVKVTLGESTGSVTVIGEAEPENPCTIYFINKSAQGWENGEAHAWGNGIDTNVKLAGTSYRYKDADGKIFDIYSATFDKAAQYIQFTYNGNWAPSGSGYDFKDEAIYCTGGIVAEKGNYSWYEELPADLQTLYFRANADWVMDKNHKTPVAVFTGKDVAENRVEMTPIAGEACLFSVEFDKNKYSSVYFVVGSITYSYDAAYVPEKDGDDWFKYILCADGDTSGNKFYVQSYLTFEKYVELRDSERQNYCVIGSTTHNWTSYKTPNVEKGLCIFETSEVGAGAKFKISYITPKNVNPDATTVDKRWWATFNLGIVGPNPADATQDGENSYIKYTPRVPMEYNHYCEYDWQVNNVGEGDSKYYVVIDPSTKVTVLITFDPNPEITNFGTTLNGYTEPGDLDQYEIENLGKWIIGNNHSGDARIRRVNQSNGDLVIRPAQRPADFDQLYSLDYQLYFNNVLVGEFAFDDIQKYAFEENGTKYYKIPFVDLTPGASDLVSFNAEYTYKENNVKFHSYTTEVKYENNISFDGLGELACDNAKAFLSHKNEEGKWVWDAIATVTFTADFDANNKTGKVFYPGCEIMDKEGNVIEGACIVDDANRFYTNEYFRNQYNWGDYTPHTKFDGNSDYVHETHNWSIKARDAKKFYIYVPNVKTTDTGTAGQSIPVSFNIKAYAQYPFLIQKVSDTYNERRNAPAAQAEDSNEATNVPMTFNLVNVPSEKEINLATTGTSGVNDIELGEEEGEVELYNLQGIRVEGQPAAGVYLRRVGNTVEKVYIR